MDFFFILGPIRSSWSLKGKLFHLPAFKSYVFKTFTNRTLQNSFYVETTAPNALDLFLSSRKGKHKRDKWVLRALGHLLISLSLAGGWASNQKPSLEGAHFVRTRCFWTCELILHHRMGDWCFYSESSGAPVKFLRANNIRTMISLGPLILPWIGLMLQYVPRQNVTIPCIILEKPAKFFSL